MNPTEVDFNSEFGKSIKVLFKSISPKRIIETGTHLGTGSTAIMASILKESYAINSKILSIEINPEYCRLAKINLERLGLSQYVEIINGLSIGREQLPTERQIEEKFVNKVWPENVYIDHSVGDRAYKYFKETSFGRPPDRMLLQCLRRFDFKPDFVLLDSGGHIGFLEYELVSRNLFSKCFLALDDIYHVKHWDSFNAMSNDPRFQFHTISKEKFGFCIAEFNPKVK